MSMRRPAAPALMLASLGFAWLVHAHESRADTPLPPPAKYMKCSPTKSFCATSDPATGETVVTNASGIAQWRLPGWHRSIFVSDDGAYVAVGYPGLELVSPNVKPGDPIVTVYDRAGVAGRVRFSDLYRDKSQLKRTASHLVWGYVLGFTRGNLLEIQLENGKRLRFKPRR